MQIRTDDEVYRVDAVWLGPPRATFPWRARYSSYGVGLLVMIFVMFVQRRLGIDLGFFSIAWALLITVAITRFVSHRIDDERPLLEWLTLFAHELRGPRRRTREVGGALATGHVHVRRDRPRLPGRATAVALPRARPASASSASSGVSSVASAGDDAAVIRPRVRPAGSQAAASHPLAGSPSAARRPGDPVRDGAPAGVGVGPAATHLTPGLEDAAPSHAPGGPRRPSWPGAASARLRKRRQGTDRGGVADAVDDGGFGPPSAATVGAAEDAMARSRRRAVPRDAPALPSPPPQPVSAAAAVASWGTPASAGEPVRVTARRVDRDRRTPDPADRPGRGPRAFGPSASAGPGGAADGAGESFGVGGSFGPGARRAPAREQGRDHPREGDGAAPPNRG